MDSTIVFCKIYNKNVCFKNAANIKTFFLLYKQKLIFLQFTNLTIIPYRWIYNSRLSYFFLRMLQLSPYLRLWKYFPCQLKSQL